MPQDSDAFNLEQALGILRRRLPLIVLCVVVMGGAAFGFSKLETKKYTATAAVAFSDTPFSQQIAGLAPSGISSNSLVAQQASNLELVRLGDMAVKTASLLGHGLTAEKVGQSISISGQIESSVVAISATATAPALAAEIANTYTHQFVEEQQNANRQYLKSALVLVLKQLAALSPQQRVGVDGLELQNRAQTLELLAGLRYGKVEVAQEALAPTSPSSPKTSRNTVLGLLLGLLIGLGLAFLLEHLDRRIREPEDLEAIYRLPLLGAVPESTALARSARRGGARALVSHAEVEVFHLIHAHLRSFNADRDIRTVLIASAALDDGRTTVARHLASAAAAGSRVLLLEADLRRPTLTEQLDIEPGLGLCDVLSGDIPMHEATRSIDLEASYDRGARGQRLDVLPAGAALTPNPRGLIDSQAMWATLKQAKSAYDLVVIDTPPLTAVSDAFPLMRKVDGVVIVGRVGRSRRDVAERLHQALDRSGAPLVGVIANGSKSSGPNSPTYVRGDKSSPAVASANGASSSPEEFVPIAKA